MILMKKKYRIFALITILFLVGCKSYIQQECEKCPEEKALLTPIIDSYYINELNEEEIFFSFNIINYGYKEAKNVEVECVLINEEDKIISRKKENIGNVASTSSKYQEIITEKPKLDEKSLYIPGCYIVSCDDCEILTNRVPEIKKTIKKYYIESLIENYNR